MKYEARITFHVHVYVYVYYHEYVYYLKKWI